jgi:alpha/beta hydrolase family protein
MTTFVLVHGAWHGGWCYKRVARLLRQAGHEVYTPTLTGLGERAHLMNRAITTDTVVARMSGATSGVGAAGAVAPHIAEPVIGPRFGRTRWLMRATKTIPSPEKSGRNRFVNEPAGAGEISRVGP